MERQSFQFRVEKVYKPEWPWDSHWEGVCVFRFGFRTLGHVDETLTPFFGYATQPRSPVTERESRRFTVKHKIRGEEYCKIQMLYYLACTVHFM